MSVIARVTMTVELEVPSTWNVTTTMKQIVDQAKTDACGIIERKFKDDRYDVQIKQMKVTAIFASEK